MIAEAAAGPTPDIVATRAEAAGLEREPLLVLEAVEGVLDDLGIGAGPVSARAIGGGHSNATFLLSRGEERVVLRRPPRPPLPPGAHDVVREGRLLQCLRDTAVPVPAVIAIEDDETVLGSPFVLMAFVDGLLIEADIPASLSSRKAQAEVSDAFIDLIADVHAVDLEAAGLTWLGKPTGYLDRQLRRFAGSWEVNQTRDVPQMAALEAWLRANQPQTPQSTLVHGDVRLGNALISDDPPGISALLDWEMATVGDPLADLGYLCASWTDRTDLKIPMFHLSTATAAPGFKTRDELLERYAERSGREVTNLPWYHALALWKAAVFMEGNYKRAVTGASDDPLLLGFGDGVIELAELGLAIGDHA